MRADRMLTILLLLQNQGKMTTRELAKQLEVSERTVVRDMEALSVSGVPVYAERGSQGGWLLADGYRTRLTGMKSEELMALLTTSHPGLLADLGIREHFDLAIQKLLASTPASIKEHTEQLWKKIHIDGAGWHQAREACPHLPTVQEAVQTDRRLRIEYRRDQETAVRVVEPLGLVAKRSVWYLVARNEEGTCRTYRISRITGAETLAEAFERPADFDLGAYWEESVESFQQRLPRYAAEVKLRPSILSRLERERYITVGEIGETDSEGWIAAVIEFATLDHACESVLSFGSSAAVIAPAELKERVIAEAQAVLERYAQSGPLTARDAARSPNPPADAPS